MTPDSLSQYSQAMGLTGYSNHHPVVHTLIIRFFLTLGNALFHDPYAAIACYTGAQMLIMALLLLHCICILYRRGAGKRLCLLFLLFYALVPYNALFAVTMWKDVLFSGVMLLFALSVYELQDLAGSPASGGSPAGLSGPTGSTCSWPPSPSCSGPSAGSGGSSCPAPR
mgnify:CR=1 FL=1